jgi:competence protein ComGC
MAMSVASILIPREDASNLEKWLNTLVVIPVKTAVNWLPAVLVLGATAYMNAMFNSQHEFLPVPVSIALSVGIEWMYVSGLAYATAIRAGFWANSVIIVGALTSCLYGVLYGLGVYKVIPLTPDPTMAFWLAIAHVVPLLLLLVLYIMSKRAFEIQHATEVAEGKALETQVATFELQQKQTRAVQLASWNQAKLELAQAKLRHEAALLEIDETRKRNIAEQAGSATATGYECPHCGEAITAGQVGPARQYGYCKACKPAK